MTPLLSAILSILILTILVWVLNRKLPTQVCSVCAGVTLTWLWILVGMWFGLLSIAKYEFVVAVLMGASIGGMVTEIKKWFIKVREKKEGKNVELLKNKLKDCC
ncbi:MAG: hypothetical protein WD963_01930 [Candidatus Paceibacterota bacterium]